MSKQREIHPFLVIHEEAQKAVARKIPFDPHWVWTDYNLAMTYKNRKKLTMKASFRQLFREEASDEEQN